MMRNILLGTQDQNLHTLCESLRAAANFHLFADVHDLLSRIAELPGILAVFVDVEWPNTQNGYNVAREIKRRHDGSITFLLTDSIDDVTLRWCAKVNAEMLTRKESVFLSKLAPIASSAGLPIADRWQTYLSKQAMSSSLSPPITQAELELERILGPMGPLLLQEAVGTTNGNLGLALKKVAAFGTTATERAQIANLSEQFH